MLKDSTCVEVCTDISTSTHEEEVSACKLNVILFKWIWACIHLCPKLSGNVHLCTKTHVFMHPYINTLVSLKWMTFNAVSLCFHACSSFMLWMSMQEDKRVQVVRMHNASVPIHKHIYGCMLLNTLLCSHAYSQIYICLRNGTAGKTAKYIVFWSLQILKSFCSHQTVTSLSLARPRRNSSLTLHLHKLWSLYLKQKVNHSICDTDQWGKDDCLLLICYITGRPSTQLSSGNSVISLVHIKAASAHTSVANSLLTFANKKPGLKYQSPPAQKPNSEELFVLGGENYILPWAENLRTQSHTISQMNNILFLKVQK